MEHKNAAFEVRLKNKTYRVFQLSNGHFNISDGDLEIAAIYLEPGNLYLEWRSTPPLDSHFVNQIGKLIYDHQMGNSVL